MKKLFYLISMIALMGSVVSCDKLNDANTSVDGFTTLKISATVPQDDVTKTYLKDSKVQWTENDVITVLAPGTDPVMSSLCSGPVETCDFEVQNWPETVTPLYAVFNGPGYKTVESNEYENYQRYSPVYDAEGKITVTLRKNQVIYHKSSFSKVSNISVGELTAKDAGYSTEMKNVCGLIMFTLESNAKEVNITDINGAPMTGKVKIVVEDELPKVCEVVTPNSTVILTSNIKDTDKTLVKGTYYACVLPGTYTPQITVTPVEGEPFVLTANSSVEIKRNEYVDFGTLAPKSTDPVPTEIKTLIVDFDELNENQPFTKNLPGSEKVSNEWAFYTLKDNTDFTFGFYAPTENKGYCRQAYKEDQVIVDYVLRIEDAYMQLPAIDGFTLTTAEITGGNSSGNKTYNFYSSVPQSSDELPLWSLEVNTTKTKSVSLKGSTAGVGYIMSGSGSNAQFKRLVLTYTK